MPALTKKLRRALTYQTTVMVGLGLVVGFAAGYFVDLAKRPVHADPRYTRASAAEMNAAIKAITEKFQSKSSTSCANVTDSVSPADRVTLFNKYLKVNQFANRAVIRSCNDQDLLLTKDFDGQWVETPINISLDLRANPIWQTECLIDDITRADDTVRPENSSIDLYNLIGCRKLKENDLVSSLLRQTDFKDNPGTLELETVQKYIKSADDFIGQ